jgi:RNA polymerase sigma-70 factor (ECF subfamily)
VGRKSGGGGRPDPAATKLLADEAELVRRCRAGERAAQDELYKRHRRQVAANLYRVMGQRDDLDDLVQEVFVIAFRGLPRFRGDARLSTWIYRICVNVALAKIRSKARRPPPLSLTPSAVETVEGGAPPPAPGRRPPPAPEQALRQRQDRERVYRVLETMSPKKRMVLYLHEIEGRDLKEIAYVIDANPVTVRTRLFYARREFYRLLAEDGEE